MKKILITLCISSLILIGCGKTSSLPKQELLISKTAKENKLNDISLFKVIDSLPNYKDVKDISIYNDLLIVYPEKSRGGKIVASGIKSMLMKNNKVNAKVIKDSDVIKGDLLASNVIVIGNSKNNRLIKEIQNNLPIVADGDKIYINTKNYEGKDYGVTYFYPNLYNMNKKMIFIMGNSDQSLKYYDFEQSDIMILKGIREIMPVNFKEVAMANFDINWNINNITEIDPKLLETGEKDVLELGELKKYEFPEWAKGKVVYQIFLRSFYDNDNDGRGDLKGLIKKLDYLKNLGVDIIWLTPIFESPSYHGYNTSDYFKVSKDYGTNEDFRELAQEMHKRDMKVILDLVLNHCSKKEKHFTDSYNNPESKFDRWFYFSNLQNTVYHDWYFTQNEKSREVVNSNMVAWNTNNKEVVDFHTSIAKFWFDPNKDGDFTDGADGYRLDFVKGPSHKYWKAFRQNIKAIKKDALLLGEAWVDVELYPPYFDNEMDTIFDFTLQGAMTSGVLTDVKNAINRENEILPEGAQMTRFMSNHDLDRFPTYIPINRLKVYSTMIFTLNGLPTLYYGDELGAKGDGADGDEGRRKPMEWYKENEGEGLAKWTSFYNKQADGISVEEQEGNKDSMLEFTKKLIKIRKEYIDIFAEGKIKFIDSFELKNNKELSARRILAYTMTNKENKKALVILNFGKAGKYKFNFESVLSKNMKLKDLISEEKFSFEKGRQTIDLDGFSKAIYIIK